MLSHYSSRKTDLGKQFFAERLSNTFCENPIEKNLQIDLIDFMDTED